MITEYHLRPATLADRPAVARLLRDSELAHQERATANWDEIARVLWRSPGFAPREDARAVESADTEVVGITAVLQDDDEGREPLDSITVLAPALEHDVELTGSLIDWSLARARERRAPALRSWVRRGDAERATLLEARGFRRIRTSWTMHRELAQGEGRGDVPEGITIRQLADEADLARVHAVHQESFARHFGFSSEAFASWRDRRIEAGSFDPTQWFVAVDGDEIVGFLFEVPDGAVPQVAELGVRSAWRGRGVATALLRHAFADIAGRGGAEVTLWVDSENETGAVGVYERVGMKAIAVTDVVETALR